MTYPSTPTIPAPRLNAALAILRIVAGGIFFAHGYMKLFVMGLPAASAFFAQVGAPLPGISAPLVTFLEVFGGIALILGLFTRPLALLFAVEMLGAILLVQIGKGLVGGYELELLLMATAITLALAGAGEYSLDRILAARRAEVRHG